jgi:hypothetical protein
MRNKVLLVINGESFRVGPQFSRDRNIDSGFKGQYLSTLSHIRFINTIKKKYGMDSDVFLSTYTFNEESDRKLTSWYNDYIVKVDMYDHLFPTEMDFVNKTIDKLSELDLSIYTHIIFIRMDYFLKKYLNEIIELFDDKVMFSFFDVNLGDNTVNHGFFVIPSIYFEQLLQKRVWSYHSSYTHTSINSMNVDCYLRSSHLCCPSGDWNPLFSYPGRYECLTYPTQISKIGNYKNIDYYKELYSNIIGTDTIIENLNKIDIEEAIEYNLNKISN